MEASYASSDIIQPPTVTRFRCQSLVTYVNVLLCFLVCFVLMILMLILYKFTRSRLLI